MADGPRYLWGGVFKRKILSILIQSFCSHWESWDPVNRFNHTSWVAVVTQTGRPKSVHNRSVIEAFGDF